MLIHSPGSQVAESHFYERSYILSILLQVMPKLPHFQNPTRLKPDPTVPYTRNSSASITLISKALTTSVAGATCANNPDRWEQVT